MPKRGTMKETPRVMVRIDRELYDGCRELADLLADQPEYRYVPLSTTTAIHVALECGLQHLRERYGHDG